MIGYDVSIYFVRMRRSSMNTPLDTVAIDDLLDRARAGCPAAWDELLRRSERRLEHLARRMLRGFPAVRRAEDTADVLQGAMIRLMRALRAVRPASTREYFGLAAEQIRRELLTLADHHRRPCRSPGGPVVSLSPSASHPAHDPIAASPPYEDLERWAAFHQAVAGLPIEQREVFMLTFYQGWAQPRIADLFGVDERTVRRRWQAACLRLNEQLGGWLDQL
jgi:RNA polymerase sigma factor (sigma-70 family)